MTGTTTTPTPSVALQNDLAPSNVAGPTHTISAVVVGPFGRHIVQRRGMLRGFLVNERERGSGVTTIQFRRAPISTGLSEPIEGATVIIPEGPPEPYRSALVSPNAELIVEPGDLLDCDVTDAASGARDLSYAPIIDQFYAK